MPSNLLDLCTSAETPFTSALLCWFVDATAICVTQSIVEYWIMDEAGTENTSG